GHINDSIQSTWTMTNNSAEFWVDIFGHQIMDVTHQYEQWACTQNQICIMRYSTVVMNYHNYETAIVKTYGIQLVGWPEGVNFANPSVISTVAEAHKLCNPLHSGSCFWKKLSKNKLELFVTELNTRHVAGKIVQKP
ncbi:hypothetical protein BKA83DRAFT_4058655, partial [Pisolithus microcarpus]